MAATDIGHLQQVHALYSDHHGWLKAWLCRQLRCPHRAADVAQSTFLRMLSGARALDGIDQPRAWLTTTAKRLIIDEARHARIEQAYLAELADASRDAELAPSPEEVMAAVQALSQLLTVLDAVSAKARTAFYLHYIEGLTQASVAADLGVSTKMVQKYLVQVLVQVGRLGIVL